MVQYTEHTLKNGLKLIVHQDRNAPIVCLNLLYKVGSRNEDPHKTGFAHLFEHLMFGGSKHIQNFDEPLQQVGGENNAFTSPDITNYYITIPSNNVETAFWLESDRMLGLSFDPKVLEVQRKVVIEEFKQRYLNQPYGDLWLKLRPLAYKVHPYQWATIGKEIKHIEDATMDDVKAFFGRFYDPSNAVLVVAGDISEERALELTEKWFGPIPSNGPVEQQLPAEPRQEESRFLEIKNDVPASAIYKAYHMPGRMGKDYHSADLMSDLLGRGKSSILHQRLVNDLHWMSSVSAYVTGSVDPGLLTITGKVNEGQDMEKVNQEIEAILDRTLNKSLDADSVQKLKNQAEATMVFSETELLNRAMGLAYANFLGETNLINDELDIVKSVTGEDMINMAREVIRPSNCSTIYYLQDN
ncbi:pitrilysin family protein [Marinoscillum sp. MHG1-6]|uniref:M16 family metallopeptidase n=1 Tax=Marinoscillum sp. MHG1-6 TaxID=2959627 RepID=UPI002157B2E0|nr:pitrilysin family protein [Marinoscillum sp. MHG1-6]